MATNCFHAGEPETRCAVTEPGGRCARFYIGKCKARVWFSDGDYDFRMCEGPSGQCPAHNATVEPKSKDISSEEWREYRFGETVHRINKPKALYIGTTTHRVVDSEGVTHCLPAPGQHGCVLTWKADPPVSF
jgi:hypothetical protein